MNMHELNCNYLGNDGQERMIRNGWKLIIPNFGESEQELYDRLLKHYGNVKIYWCGTRIRGIHSIFAMVK